MLIQKNGQAVVDLLPSYVGMELIIGIDSSKTNTAIDVTDGYGNELDYYEFSGVASDDVLDMCFTQRKQLKQLFHNARIKIVGIENIITKNSEGMDRHVSRFKITSIFMSLITFFQDTFNITPELVNNQEWKAAILPHPFNTREFKKGSIAWFKSINSKYQYCTDDVTDAKCIRMYLCKKHGIVNAEKVIAAEASRYTHTWRIITNDASKAVDSTKFQYNPELTLEQNVVVMSNRLRDKKFATAIVSINEFSVEQLYTMCSGKFGKVEREVTLCVMHS